MLRPLQSDEHVAKLKSRYEEIRTLSKRASTIVDSVANSYTHGLDEIVGQVETILDEIRTKARKELSGPELNRLVLRLPTLIYRAVDLLDSAAIEASISKAANKSVYATYYLDSQGTIPEREAFASLKAAEESVIVDLSRHVYNRVKGKIDAAQSLYDGIKKVMTAKESEVKAFGRSQND